MPKLRNESHWRQKYESILATPKNENTIEIMGNRKFNVPTTPCNKNLSFLGLLSISFIWASSAEGQLQTSRTYPTHWTGRSLPQKARMTISDRIPTMWHCQHGNALLRINGRWTLERKLKCFGPLPQAPAFVHLFGERSEGIGSILEPRPTNHHDPEDHNNVRPWYVSVPWVSSLVNVTSTDSLGILLLWS